MVIASFIISILSLLVAVISIVVQAEIATYIFCGCIILLIITLIIFYYKSKKSNISQSNSTDTFKKINQNITAVFNIKDKIDEELLKDNKKSRRFFIDEFVSILNSLCTIVKDLTNLKFSSCLKLLNFEKNKDIFEWDIVTVARSENSHHGRKSTARHSTANNNTAFKEILDDNHRNFFICRDLNSYSKVTNNEYVTANKSFSKYYNSVIVVPVALETEYNKKDICAENIVYGFLCIDSLKSFKDKDADLLLEIAQLYATIICGILQKYKNLKGKYLYEIFA